MSGPVVFVLKGYPRLSETFVAEEIRGLERRGLDLRIVALRRPTDDRVHPVHRAIRAPVAYLPEYLHQEPWRVIRSWGRVRRHPGLTAAWRQLWADLPRDRSRNRLRRFGQALVLAAELPAEVGHLHAHFLHTPASVVAYAALILGLPWSCSAHAKDIWTSPDWDLRQKLQAAAWTVTCTRAGQARLDALAPAGRPTRLVYHGLRLDRFRPLLTPRPPRDGQATADPVRLLSVGRAVPKKGFDTLLDALAELPAGTAWTWTHVGGGPELGALKRQATRRGVAARITFEGALDQDAVLAHYIAADLFVLPCRITEDGDRDGLPNVLVEAQSQGLACLSTPVGGVAELIADEITGVLVPPDDPPALAAALRRLIADPAARARLGRAGAARVAAAFDADRGLDELLSLFGHDRAPAAGDRDMAVAP